MAMKKQDINLLLNYEKENIIAALKSIISKVNLVLYRLIEIYLFF